MDILSKIVEDKKIEVENLPKSFEYNNVKNISLTKALEIFSKNKKPFLIAEVKKASPSKGVIREDFDPIKIAIAYEKAGAGAISVLTDEKYFKGHKDYIKQVKEAVDLPVLRKDFIVDEKQIEETKALGADIILLIARILNEEKLKRFYSLSKEAGLDVLLEIHNKEEFYLAKKLGFKIIGINNRDLKSFETSIQKTLEIIENEEIKDLFIISESGIESSSDIKFLFSNGVKGFLVGESLMKKSDIETATRELLDIY